VIYGFGYLFQHTLDIIVGRPAWSFYILYSLIYQFVFTSHNAPNMNHIYLSVTVILFVLCTGFSGCTAASLNYSADDDRIVIMGRYQTDDTGAVSFGASGVTFIIKFSGTFLDIVLEDEFRYGTSNNYFTVIVDNRPPVRFRTESGKTEYRIAGALPAGEHTVILSKASEGQNGRNRLAEVRCRKLQRAAPLPERKLEFIGDSITCGFGANDSEIPCRSGTWFDQHDAWNSYGSIVARRLQTQWHLNAISGIGMIRNWNSPGPVMPDRYAGVFIDYADTISSWDFSTYQPDLLIIGLGTNDFSDGDGVVPRPPPDGPVFIERYIHFIGFLRSQYPNTRFLLLSSPLLDEERNRVLESYLGEIVVRLSTESDFPIDTFSFSMRYQNGCDGHPSNTDHVQMADELEPFVRNLMGWN
jgi:lysophospholipase L1-like esterase